MVGLFLLPICRGCTCWSKNKGFEWIHWNIRKVEMILNKSCIHVFCAYNYASVYIYIYIYIYIVYRWFDLYLEIAQDGKVAKIYACLKELISSCTGGSSGRRWNTIRYSIKSGLRWYSVRGCGFRRSFFIMFTSLGRFLDLLPPKLTSFKMMVRSSCSQGNQRKLRIPSGSLCSDRSPWI